MANSNPAPTTATPKLRQFQAKLTADPVSHSTIKPPMNAPSTPIRIFPKQPNPRFRPAIILATQPASAPKIIHEISPIATPLQYNQVGSHYRSTTDRTNSEGNMLRRLIPTELASASRARHEEQQDHRPGDRDDET